jgi:hypothetical protein
MASWGAVDGLALVSWRAWEVLSRGTNEGFDGNDVAKIKEFWRIYLI